MSSDPSPSSGMPENGVPQLQQLPLSQLVRIDVEEAPRKMRLMFGERREGQVVKLRSDGLRSRAIRAEAKKNREEQEEKERKEAETMDRTIDDVAEASGEPSEGPSTSSGPPAGRMMAPNRGNRVYHPPREFHGTSTMVTHKNRWSYRMACDIDAAEQNDDGQMYYIADPFLPMPRNRRSHTTAVRMNYAAQRLENRKFRGQASRQKEIIGKESESATCDRCGMRYFLPSINMQERISYVLPANEDEELPTVLFECPVCKVTTRTD